MREDGTRASHVTIIRLSHRNVQSLTLMVCCQSTWSCSTCLARAGEVLDYNWIRFTFKTIGYGKSSSIKPKGISKFSDLVII
jgi:hypothetical protein